MGSVQVTLAMAVVIAYLVLALAVGRVVLLWFSEVGDAMTFGAAPIVGAAVLALQLWLYGVVHLPWNVVTLFLPWLVVGLVFRDRYRRALTHDWAALRASFGEIASDRLDVVLIAAGVIIAAFYLLKLVTQPVTGPDAIAMWLYKAKVAYAHGSYDLRAMLAVPAGPTRHLDYPPLFPLMIATVYTLLGHVNDLTGKAVNFIFFVGGVVTIYTVLAQSAGRRFAVVGAFLLAAMPFFSMALIESRAMGYADYALAILMLMALASLYRAERGDLRMLALALAFASFAALTKNEGLVFLVIVVAVGGMLAGPALARLPGWWGPRSAVAGALLVGVLPVAAWLALTRSLRLSSDLLGARNWHALIPSLPGRAATISRFAWHQLSVRNDYPWLVLGYVIAAAGLLQRRAGPGLAILAVVTLQLLSYFVVYLLSPYDLNWHLATSYERVVLQMVPSLVLLVALAAARPARIF